ncbi:type IV secretion/conjugal transfer ATPase VirB4 family, partial [Streptomyces coelicoflavus ZG0656]
DGLLFQVIQLRGLLFETADTAELNYRKALRDAMLRAIGTSRFALYHHIERRRVTIDAETTYPDAFSQVLGERWADRLSAKTLFANDLYLTLVRRPLQGRIGLADQLRNWIAKTGDTTGAAEAYELAQLDAGREALFAALGDYAPRLLGIEDTANGPCSEPPRLPVRPLQ